MESNIFADKSTKPDDKNLAEVLGKTETFWQEIKKHLQDEYGDVKEEWKDYYKKSNWVLQVIRKKRTMFWFKPFKDYFCIAFWFGDKAVAVVEKSDLPESIINSLKNAKKYQIGRSVQIYVKHSEDVENVKKLIEIKIKN